MTEFKVGDKVEIVRLGGLSTARYFDVGEHATVTEVDYPNTDSYPVGIVGNRGFYTWAQDGALELVTDEPVEYSEDTCGEDGVCTVEPTPIDLPTVKFIYKQWETILDMAGLTDEVAANVFSGYISGLMQGLKGDFDD